MWEMMMKKDMDKHNVTLTNKEVEFLMKCIDICQSTQSIKPDLSEAKVIKKLSELNDRIQDDKYGETIFYDLGRG